MKHIEISLMKEGELSITGNPAAGNIEIRVRSEKFVRPFLLLQR